MKFDRVDNNVSVGERRKMWPNLYYSLIFSIFKISQLYITYQLEQIDNQRLCFSDQWCGHTKTLHSWLFIPDPISLLLLSQFLLHPSSKVFLIQISRWILFHTFFFCLPLCTFLFLVPIKNVMSILAKKTKKYVNRPWW